MSVYIPGMEMPETCDGCPFHHYHSVGEYVCEATPMFYPLNLANTKGARKEWCPLIELPAEHGRLIDADALLQEFYKAQKSADAHGRGFSDAFYVGTEICAEWWAVECKVEDAPTIIPAEEGE